MDKNKSETEAHAVDQPAGPARWPIDRPDRVADRVVDRPTERPDPAVGHQRNLDQTYTD